MTITNIIIIESVKTYLLEQQTSVNSLKLPTMTGDVKMLVFLQDLMVLMSHFHLKYDTSHMRVLITWKISTLLQFVEQEQLIPICRSDLHTRLRSIIHLKVTIQ